MTISVLSPPWFYFDYNFYFGIAHDRGEKKMTGSVVTHGFLYEADERLGINHQNCAIVLNLSINEAENAFPCKFRHVMCMSQPHNFLDSCFS